jgi:hypothetical protein
MKHGMALILVVAAAVIAAPELLAKNETTRITIAGGGLPAPIVITDPPTLKRFNVWNGPGTGGTVQGVPWKAAEGFVIAGTTPIEDRPAGLARYEVSFLVDRQDRNGQNMAYVVFYEYDARSARGFVYFPGRNDSQWRTNVFLILREIEGHWYAASQEWKDTVTPLIKGTLQN